MSKLLKGAEVTKNINENLTIRVNNLRENGILPALAIIRIGEEPDQVSYEKGATRRCEAIGVAVEKATLAGDAPQKDLLCVISELNDTPSIHGILLLRPLPKHIDEDLVREAISPEKDVDGITNASLAGVFTKTPVGYPPCTAQAVMEVLDHYAIDVSGKRVAVIGRSLVVGKPVALMLTDKNATVTLCHSYTKNLSDVTKASDIIVVAAGISGIIKREHIIENHVIIDVGIHVDDEGKLSGDVDFADADGFVSAITPVPGGVGGVTTSVLVKHVVISAERSML